MLKRILPLAVIAGMTLFLASVASAIVTPPVFQNLGFTDTVFTNLETADCLNEANGCHVYGPEGGAIRLRHHNLTYTPLSNPSVAPFPQYNPTPPGEYTCLGCHNETFQTNPMDCLFCHGDSASPHHTTEQANLNNCDACHSYVDNANTPQAPPAYNPIEVTPWPNESMGTYAALEENSYGTLAGGCAYCHDSDVPPPAVDCPDPAGAPCVDPTLIYSNYGTHHSINLTDFGIRCTLCHNPVPGTGPPDYPQDYSIRTPGCGTCHGRDILHATQADSDGGGVDIGFELSGYGHVGSEQPSPENSDCWGCHGYNDPAATASSPNTGPAMPSADGADIVVVQADTPTTVVLSGAAFTSSNRGVDYESSVVMTAADGSSVTLSPDAISESTIAVTISAAGGNYDLRAVNDDGLASNPVVISAKSAAAVTGFTCSGNVATITGSGFSGYAEGSGTEVTGTVGNKKNRTTETGAVNSWTDTQIVATFSDCPRDVAVTTVNDLGGGGDPPAVCADITDGTACTDAGCDWSCKKNRCSCSDGGGDPPGGSCSDNGDQQSCVDAGCNCNIKKLVCR